MPHRKGPAESPSFAQNGLCMFIKNQTFKDEDTLLEVLFDFDLGTPTTVVTEAREQIERDLKDNQAYQDYYTSLTDEEDRMELATEERYIRLAEALMEQFDTFAVDRQQLFGVKGGAKTLLFEMDL